MERFRVGQLKYKQKAQKIQKFQRSQGRQKIKVFPKGTTWPKILHLKPQLFSICNKRNF